MKNKKMSLFEIMDKVDAPEFFLFTGIGLIAALASFIGLSYLTSSSVISSAVGLTLGVFVGYRLLLFAANSPPSKKADSDSSKEF